MGKPYSKELDQVPNTLRWATARCIDPSEAPPRDGRPIVAIGSGGSFSAADFASRAFQRNRSHLCIAESPLEYLRTSAELGAHHAVLLSAEGKNSDIRATAAAALLDAKTITAITFQVPTPLGEVLRGHAKATIVETVGPWGRDGYLATNSLVATCASLAGINNLGIEVTSAVERFEQARSDLKFREFVDHVALGRKILAIHGIDGTPAAIDLESKFAEAAFGTVQRTDLRQFAHGRHIQLGQGGEQYVVVAFVNGPELDLWAAVQARLPKGVPVLTCVLPVGLADAAIQGLLFTLVLVEALGDRLGLDPGRPAVPEFAREIHGLETAEYVRLPHKLTENAKLVALFRKGVGSKRLIGALDAYVTRLARACIKGLVLDFDGTCCETPRRWEGIQPEFGEELERLLGAGMVVAFASGRGDSLYDDLRGKVSERFWGQVWLGCHSGSSRVRLSESWQEGGCFPAMRAVKSELAQQGIDASTCTLRVHAGQITIEPRDQQDLHGVFVIAGRIASAHPGWRAFRSAHSADLLAPGASKAAVAQWLAQGLGADAESELLRIGDRGEVFGNDSELLGAGLSLTVDGVSSAEDSCWLLGSPSDSASQRTLAYLRAVEPTGAGQFRINAEALGAWAQDAKLSIRQLLGGNP